MFVIMAFAESLHGIIREACIVQVFGVTAAKWSGFVVGSLIILLIAAISSPWLRAETRQQQYLVGSLWLFCLLLLETAVGLARGYDLQRIMAEFDITQGNLMGIGLLVIFVAPFTATGLREYIKGCG